MTESLKNKTIKGVGWSFADNISNQGITFLVGLVLARLLSPKEYGLIGIITIFITIFNGIVDSGFSSALIRKLNVSERDYNTTFYMNLAVSLVLMGVLYILAPYIALFFHSAELVALTKAMSIILVINALSIVQRTIHVKAIDFKSLAKASLISSVSSGVIGIGMALYDFGVWSLVGQQVSRQGLNTVFLWIYSSWRPRRVFSMDSFNELWSYGWKLMVSGTLNNVWVEIYQVVIGRYYTTSTLGLYTRAKQFSMIFSSNITGVVQRVSYPILSGLQDDKVRLKQAYKRVIRTTMLVTFVFMLGLGAVAETMVEVIIGKQWLPCVPYIQIIVFSMMLFPLHALNLNMLQVQGRSDLFLKLEIIKKIIGVAPLLLGIFVNIYAMLICSIFTGFIGLYVNAYYSGPFLNYSIIEQIKDVLPSLVVALLMAAPVYLLTYLPLSPLLIFPMQLVVGTTLTIFICEIAHLEEYLELKDVAKKTIVKIKNISLKNER